MVFSDRRTLDRQIETRPYHIASWLDVVETHSRSPRTVNLRASVIRSWFRWLYDQELVGRSPFKVREHLRKVDRAQVVSRPGQRRQSLRKGEAQRVVDWCLHPGTEPEWGCGVALCLSGLRTVEVERVQLEDLSLRSDAEAWNGQARMLVRGKGKKTRVVLLEHWAVAAIERHLRAINAGVGRPRTRGPLMSRKREAIGYWVGLVADMIGRPEITPHDLRRTNCTLLGNAGVPLEQRQEHLGHANPQTTQDCYDTEQRPMTATTGLEIQAC